MHVREPATATAIAEGQPVTANAAGESASAKAESQPTTALTEGEPASANAKLEAATPTEEFPYPMNITRDDFSDIQHFDADAFLSRHHRYTSLDLLLSDLTNLSKSLNKDLLALVNDEYTSFIQLGQSISDCLGLINLIAGDTAKLNTVLATSLGNLQESSQLAAAAVQHKKRLNLLKNKAKLILLLSDQAASFETLLGLNVTDADPARLSEKLRSLATLYLSITKIHSVVSKVPGPSNTGSPEEDSSLASDLTPSVSASCPLFEKVLEPKIFSLKHEFKLYLDELLVLAKKSPATYNTLILDILHVYRVTGHTSDAIKCLGRGK